MVWGILGTTATYGSLGNLLDDGVRTYDYDYANRLIAVVSGTLTTTYIYNGDGHRLAKAVNGQTTTYTVAVLGLSQVLVETTGGDSIVYLYGHDLLAEEDDAWNWHLGDGLGSVRQLADSGGGVSLAQGYTPFGVPLWDEGGGTTGYGFTGERWEAYSQLLFLRARYYEPETGRFLSQDLLSANISIPQTRNSYSYVTNNAVNRVDPSGHVGEQPAPSSQVCSDWKGIPKSLWCERAENGSLEAKASFYYWLAVAGRVRYGWDVAADLLHHYLYASGTYVVLDHEWLLQGPQDKERRDELFSQFVDQHLKPVTCDCTMVAVEATLTSRADNDLVVPETSTDIGVAIGKHWLDGFFKARMMRCCPYVAEVVGHYQVVDRFDFDPLKGLEINQWGVGYVPHQWLIDLRDAGWAAEFDVFISWQETTIVQWD